MGCPICLVQVRVSASGLVKSHKHQGSNCDGSGHRPRNLATKQPLPSLADIEKFSIPTRKHVPVSCHNLWARVVSSTYAKVKNNPSVTDNWIELFILSQCVLRSNSRGESKHLRYEEKNVQSRFNRWLNGEATQLWFEATSSVKPLVIKPPPHPGKSMLNALGNLTMKEVTVKPLPRSAQRVYALMTRLYRSCKKNILLLSLPCCLPSLLQILSRAAFPVTY